MLFVATLVAGLTFVLAIPTVSGAEECDEVVLPISCTPATSAASTSTTEATMTSTTERATTTTAAPRTTTTVRVLAEEDEEAEEAEEAEAEETTTSEATVTTVSNLLVPGDGTHGAESTTTTSTELIAATAEDDGPSDGTLIALVIAGLVVVALAVGILTWRYWAATRPPALEDEAAQRSRTPRVAR